MDDLGKKQFLDQTMSGQSGLANFTQLRAHGFSRSGIKRRVLSGRLKRAHPRTYRAEGSPQDWRQQAAAALLWLGPTCCLTGRTACRAWRIEGADKWTVIEVTGEKSVRRRKSVIYRRTKRLPKHHVRIVDGVRVTSPARTVFDLAGYVPSKRLGKVIDEFLRRRLMTLEDVADVLVEMGTRGRKGMTSLRSLLGDRMGTGGPSHNETELRLYKILSRAGLSPTRQFEVPVPGDRYLLDCAWPPLLDAEADSYEWHGSHSAWHRDYERDRVLRSMGWRVVRFAAQDIWFHPDYVVAEVTRELRLAGLLEDES